jgi:hypothetical protein
MITFLALLTQLRAEIWPDGEAKTLRTAHTGYFKAALTDLQKWIPELQQHNTTVYERCERLWEDAKTVVTAPNGIVTRVFTITNEEWRDKVWYQSSNFLMIERWAKTLWEAVTPENTGFTALNFGFKYEEAEVDSDIGRARVGIWCIHRGNLYVAPWLQSNEKLVIEWEGVKTSWVDADQLDDDLWSNDVQEGLKLYILWQHEFYFGDRIQARELERVYREKLSDLMVVFRDRTKQQPLQEIAESVDYLSQDMLDDDDEAADGVETPCDENDVDVDPGEETGVESGLPRLYDGEDEPEGNQAGCVGSTYTKTSTPRALYGKFSGGCTSTGWILLSGEGS